MSNFKKNDDEDYTLFRLNNNNGNNNIIPEQDMGQLQPLNRLLQLNKEENDKNIVNNKIKCGRKKKDSLETGKHNKYSGDNLFRKCKISKS